MDNKGKTALRHLFLKFKEAVDERVFHIANIPPFLNEESVSRIIDEALRRAFEKKLKVDTQTVFESSSSASGALLNVGLITTRTHLVLPFMA